MITNCKLTHIVGARPQFIKMAVVSRAIAKHNKHIKELIIHTGQHYDYELSKIFFDELEIPKPNYNLGIGSAGHGEQTGEMLKRTEPVLLKERPDIVLVYGDTNSTLAGALAAAKLHPKGKSKISYGAGIPVAHVEAGLRSFNRKMPEEINRVLTDHLSTILFCPTELAVRNLQREGFTNIAYGGKLVPPTEISLKADNPLVANVGDVMFDSVLYNLKLAEESSAILNHLHLLSPKPNELHEPNKPKNYVLATIHRAENTDDPERLRSIFQALNEIARDGIPVIIPLHPRTRKQLNALSNPMNPTNSTNSMNLIIIDPVSYLDMLLLERHAQVILTDSGGVQKEAFILKTPCVTLREETEWTETVEASWNILTGADKGGILKAVERFNSQKTPDPQGCPYGDGQAGTRIVEVISGCLRN